MAAIVRALETLHREQEHKATSGVDTSMYAEAIEALEEVYFYSVRSCKTCKGLGKIIEDSDPTSRSYSTLTEEQCPTCGGTGRLYRGEPFGERS